MAGSQLLTSETNNKFRCTCAVNGASEQMLPCEQYCKVLVAGNDLQAPFRMHGASFTQLGSVSLLTTTTHA